MGIRPPPAPTPRTMNPADDPNLTSWALNELGHEERTAFEERMKLDPTTFAEAQMTQSFCRFVQSQLRDDTTVLTDSQRTRLSSYVSWRPRFEEQMTRPIFIAKPKKLRWYQKPSFIIGFSAAAAIALAMLPYWGERMFPTKSAADYIPMYVTADSPQPEFKRSVMSPGAEHETPVVQQGASLPAKLADDAAARLRSEPQAAFDIDLNPVAAGGTLVGGVAPSPGRRRLVNDGGWGFADDGADGSAVAASSGATTLTIHGGTTLTVSGGSGTTITVGSAGAGQTSTPVSIDIRSGTVHVTAAPPAARALSERSGDGRIRELDQIIPPQTAINTGTLSASRVRDLGGGEGMAPVASNPQGASSLAALSFTGPIARKATLLPSGGMPLAPDGTGMAIASSSSGSGADSGRVFPFSPDVSSYQRVKRSLDAGRLPAREVVNLSGIVNALPCEDDINSETVSMQSGLPFTVSAAVAEAPWQRDHRLVRICIRASDDVQALSAQLEFNPATVRFCRLVGGGAMTTPHQFNAAAPVTGHVRAGTSLTVLYEVVPSGPSAGTGVLMKAAFRHKKPGSSLISISDLVVRDEGRLLKDSSPDFKLAAAAAGFSMLVGAASPGDFLSWDDVHALAVSAQSGGRSGDRVEFVRLIEKAADLVTGVRR